MGGDPRRTPPGRRGLEEGCSESGCPHSEISGGEMPPQGVRLKPHSPPAWGGLSRTFSSPRGNWALRVHPPPGALRRRGRGAHLTPTRAGLQTHPHSLGWRRTEGAPTPSTRWERRGRKAARRGGCAYRPGKWGGWKAPLRCRLGSLCGGERVDVCPVGSAGPPPPPPQAHRASPTTQIHYFRTPAMHQR